MAYDEELPVNIVAPNEFNIDPSTTRLAPLEYGGMLAQGAANWYGANVVPAIESVGNAIHQAMLPGGEQYDPPDYNKPAKESEPLLKAIDSGYADKKIMNPVQMIRESIRKGDMEGAEKGYKKLVDLLSNTGMTTGQRFADAYLRQGISARQRELAGKMAADVVMKEMLGGASRAEEATSAGLMRPSELLPEQRMPVFQNLIPAEGMPMEPAPDGSDPYRLAMPISSVQPSLTPAQEMQMPSTEIVDPRATLTPLQESLVHSRVQGEAHPRQPRAEKSTTPSDINARGIQADIDVIRTQEGREPKPDELSGIIAKWSGYDLKAGDLERKKELDKSLIALREVKQKLYDTASDKNKAEIDLIVGKTGEIDHRIKWLDAQTEYKKHEGELQIKLQEMKNTNHPEHIVYRAIANVRAALEKGEKPNEVDEALFTSFITKGSAQYGTTFLGEMYNRYTGKMVQPDQPVNKGGIWSTLKQYLGDLLGVKTQDAEKQLDELDKQVPAPLSAKEKAELEELRKKHGRTN